MRASDFLTALSMDLTYLEITKLVIKNDDALFPVTDVLLIEQGLLLVSTDAKDTLTLKELLVMLMLHKQCSIYKGTRQNLNPIYGYSINEKKIVV